MKVTRHKKKGDPATNNHQAPNSTTEELNYRVNPIFSRSPKKKDLANAPFQGRSPLKRVNLREKQNAVEGALATLVFQVRYGRILANGAISMDLFSHSGSGWGWRRFPDRNPAIGARIGLVFPQGTYPLIPSISYDSGDDHFTSPAISNSHSNRAIKKNQRPFSPSPSPSILPHFYQ